MAIGRRVLPRPSASCRNLPHRRTRATTLFHLNLILIYAQRPFLLPEIGKGNVNAEESRSWREAERSRRAAGGEANQRYSPSHHVAPVELWSSLRAVELMRETPPDICATGQIVWAILIEDLPNPPLPLPFSPTPLAITQ